MDDFTLSGLSGSDDPFVTYLDRKLPTTPGFVATFAATGLPKAMSDNPILHGMVVGMYPDARSIVN
jgi:hypothetical protein